MGIKKVGDNKYQIRIEYLGEEVKRICYGTRADANHALAVLKEEIAKAKANNSVWSGFARLKGKPKTFEDVAVMYIQALATDKLKTLKAYDSALKHHIIPEFGHLPIRNIDQASLERFRARLIRTPSQSKRSSGKPLQPRTINFILTVAISILNFAERHNEIDRAPKTKSLPEPPSDIDPLSLDELQLALDATLPFWRPVIQLLASTGMREGELFGLRWSDVDLQKNEIRINKQLSDGVETTTKTVSSNRTVAITPIAREALLELRGRSVINIGGRLMTSKEGKQQLPTQAYEAWTKALKKAGLRHRPLHQLRHTYATTLFAQGVSVGWVSKQLGHSSIKQTFDTYIRYIPSYESKDLAAATEAFKSLVKNAPINNELGQ